MLLSLFVWKESKKRNLYDINELFTLYNSCYCFDQCKFMFSHQLSLNIYLGKYSLPCWKYYLGIGQFDNERFDSWILFSSTMKSIDMSIIPRKEERNKSLFDNDVSMTV